MVLKTKELVKINEDAIQNLFSIKDKVVLITGSGKGIGRHLAYSMAQCSAFVYCIDKKFPEEIPKDIKKNMFHITCDITNEKSFRTVCKKIFLKHKKIDVLINNAGITTPLMKGKLFYEKENWEKTININLTASFFCSQEVIRYMIKRKSGSIINITSLNAEIAFPKNPSYVASKGGLKMLGKALAKDWGKYGIRVNNLGPGYIKTDMTKKSFSNKKLREERTKHTMLGRWGDKNDLVGPCIFLASDASSYITGQDVYVDGGWLANSIIDE